MPVWWTSHRGANCCLDVIVRDSSLQAVPGSEGKQSNPCKIGHRIEVPATAVPGTRCGYACTPWCAACSAWARNDLGRSDGLNSTPAAASSLAVLSRVALLETILLSASSRSSAEVKTTYLSR